VIAEHADSAVTQRLDKFQGLQRLRTPVDQVPAKPERIVRRIKFDFLE